MRVFFEPKETDKISDSDNAYCFTVLGLLAVLSISVLFGGCGVETFRGPSGHDGKSCTVSKSGSVTTIKCPDGTSTTIPDGSNGTNGQDGANGTNGTDGHDGSNGTDGTNGQNGHNSIINVISASASQCSNGGQVLIMATDLNDNGVVDTSDLNIQTALVCNGLNGSDGHDGEDGHDGVITVFSSVDYIKPYRTDSDVMLRMADGTLLGIVTDSHSGRNARLVIMADGSYQTSQGHAYSISTTGNTRIVTSSTGSQSWTIL